MSGTIITIQTPDQLESGALEKIAQLHLACMPSTLTSQRGLEATCALYNHLLSVSGQVHLAVSNGEIVGVVSATDDYSQLASWRSLFVDFGSWFGAVKKIGIRSTFLQLWDSYQVAQFVNSNHPRCRYVNTLFVREDLRSKGFARTLILSVISSSTESEKVLLVDTTKTNQVARAFYLRVGFEVAAETRFSVIFMKRNDILT